jgi:hypothetical protein
MGAHYFIGDNEIQYELAHSKDKDFVVIEGANHGFTPREPCATTPGQYSNTVRNSIRSRFASIGCDPESFTVMLTADRS